ncbi:MAG: prenyltransferase [Actinomycetota bacterium]|nr:prenyltransferase [Actinomycetota bacterium]
MTALAVAGSLTAQQAALTASSIVAAQLPSGAIPWYAGGPLDPWDHVQSAMGLTVAGRLDEAVAAYEWSRSAQRPDGTWAMAYDGDTVTDAHTDANFGAYLATGVWHHWRATGDRGQAERMWPTVDAGIDAVLRLQRSDGSIPWAVGDDGRPSDESFLTGCSSIQLSVRCALALAGVVEDPRPQWRAPLALLRHAVRDHPEAFSPKPTHAMDWYYPVLTGARTGSEAHQHLAARWQEFVVADLGVHCVSDHPWVTGGETAELVLALAAIGRHGDARALLASMQHLREDDGSYWTGLVYADGLRWPVERTTWTGATVLLAADAISGATPAAGLFRGDGLPAADPLPSLSFLSSLTTLSTSEVDPCPCLLAS